MNLQEDKELTNLELVQYVIAHPTDTKAVNTLTSIVNRYHRTRTHQYEWEIGDSVTIQLLDNNYLPMNKFIIHYKSNNKNQTLTLLK